MRPELVEGHNRRFDKLSAHAPPQAGGRHELRASGVTSRIARRRAEEERADTLYRLRVTTKSAGSTRDPRRASLASEAIKTACITNTRHSMGLGRGHALGRGSQDSTGDPKGSLKAVPHFGDASRFSAASSMREQLTTAPMLSAHCFAVRENRRKLSCRRGVVRCLRIARKSAVVVTLREREACSLLAPSILGRAMSDARSSKPCVMPPLRPLPPGQMAQRSGTCADDPAAACAARQRRP